MSKARLRLFCKDMINGDFLYQILFNYTAGYTYRTIVADDQRYRLITLTHSGTITFLEEYVGDVWLCGGGEGGGGGGATPYMDGYTAGIQSGHGGGGGRCAFENNVALRGSIPVIIGARGKGGARGVSKSWGNGEYSEHSTPGDAGGKTSFGDLGADGGKNASGGSGGGLPRVVASNYPYKGLGDGISTVPFFDTQNFDPLCAGGASGTLYEYSHNPPYQTGCDGGSNGSNSGPSTPSYSEVPISAKGGFNGGGFGGSSGSLGGGNGANFGAGGGGGEASAMYGEYSGTDGGAGYNGVVMIRIPV